MSDPSKTVARAYGVVGSSGYASRWTFYIDVNGRIAAIDKKVNAGSHGEDIVKHISHPESQLNLQSEI